MRVCAAEQRASRTYKLAPRLLALLLDAMHVGRLLQDTALGGNIDHPIIIYLYKQIGDHDI